MWPIVAKGLSTRIPGKKILGNSKAYVAGKVNILFCSDQTFYNKTKKLQNKKVFSAPNISRKVLWSNTYLLNKLLFPKKWILFLRSRSNLQETEPAFLRNCLLIFTYLALEEGKESWKNLHRMSKSWHPFPVPRLCPQFVLVEPKLGPINNTDTDMLNDLWHSLDDPKKSLHHNYLTFVWGFVLEKPAACKEFWLTTSWLRHACLSV